MNWQQIVIIVFYAMDLGIEAAKSGEPRTGKHSFLAALLIDGFLAWVLYSAGFWG